MKNRRWGAVTVGGVALGIATALLTSGCGGTSGGSAGTAGAGAGSGGSAGASPVGGGSNAGAGAGDGSAGSAAAAGLGGTGAQAGSGGASLGGSSGSGGHGGSGGSGGSAGRGGTGGSAANDALGQSCTIDLDCGSGLICLQPNAPSLDGKGPANGLCTRACATGAECAGLTPSAGCVNFGNASYCLEACTQGSPVDLAMKCHGRSDQACTGFSDTVSLCYPLCRADAECAAGQFCDPRTTLCSPTKPTGDPVGTPCNPAAVVSNCLGSCLQTSAAGVTPPTGVCVQTCSGLTECMYSGNTPGGFCVGAFNADFSVLDWGYCEPACNCSANCKISGDLCQAWTAPLASIASDLGSAGFCYPNVVGSTELTSCN